MKILVAEDERGIRRIIKKLLEKANHTVLEADNGLIALNMVNNDSTINLVIMDVMMPEMDGYEACKKIKQTRDIPILILTAKNSVDDQLESFDIGADDYISKPFNNNILLARIEALLRRIPQSNSLEYREIKLLPNSREMALNSELIMLSNKEYQIMEMLVKSPGIIVNKDEILESVWGDINNKSRSVDTHIKRLRTKLGEYGDYVKTVHGVGYKLEK